MAVTKTSSAAGGRVAGESGSRNLQGVDWLYFDVVVLGADLNTSADAVLLYKFPDDGDVFFPGWAEAAFIATPDMDSGTDSDIDLSITGSDGVEDTLLIGDGAIGQAASTADYSAVMVPFDISGKYLTLIQNTTTAGMGATTEYTITVAVAVIFGKKKDRFGLV